MTHVVLIKPAWRLSLSLSLPQASRSTLKPKHVCVPHTAIGPVLEQARAPKHFPLTAERMRLLTVADNLWVQGKIQIQKAIHEAGILFYLIK